MFVIFLLLHGTKILLHAHSEDSVNTGKGKQKERGEQCVCVGGSQRDPDRGQRRQFPAEVNFLRDFGEGRHEFLRNLPFV